MMKIFKLLLQDQNQGEKKTHQKYPETNHKKQQQKSTEQKQDS